MEIEVTDKAAEWFKKELELTDGEAVQFFVRYGGHGDFQTGFSLGVTKKDPEDPAVETTKDNIQFFIENKDIWYFDGKNFLVEFNEDREEIVYKHNN
ncbi:HesB/YadR/YfhF family protein [Evansella sp. LMS18]|uniref:HesB/YadR/YfhF family protein n=1 Tax=Evansella sp. LMS18 TaxID=2924033 RepID=UPI0020D14CC8|nr:HesB/YadR/YfhF family protein [Evansella sp. LMS18]UTR11147.1 HesB/YadR/YfhF family protein [Evansella sp. LMS18]